MHGLIRTSWTYQGNPVWLARSARMSKSFIPNMTNSHMVQEVLSHMSPWRQGRHVIGNYGVPGARLTADVMRVSDWNEVIWGIHKYHRNGSPQPSPFIKPRSWPRTNNITVVLTDTPQKLILVRVYASDPAEPYVPPLPWMDMAAKVRGGKQACLSYWLTHAYVLRDMKLMVRQVSTAPSWWSEAKT